MNIEWENGFEIRVTADHGTALISANREGLLSAELVIEKAP